jgi:type IV secretion system protein VirB9
VRLAGKCDCSTNAMISAFSDAGYLMPCPPQPRSNFFEQTVLQGEVGNHLLQFGGFPAKILDLAGRGGAGRVENANAAARVQPRREGYYNAIQIYPWSDGALYQVYAAPGQITDIALEPGESLTGAGPIAAGDTARWIIGDTESGSGVTRRVHILVKPSRPDITTNLVVTTDRRVYLIELRSGEKPYMPAVAWAYPAPPASQGQGVPTAPVIPAAAARNHRYTLTGDNPPWKPVAVYDDGRRVYVEFPRGIVQGEMPPIFVIGADGEAQIVNSRIHQHILIVDRLFGAAELRLGSGTRQQTVRIVRTDGRPS